MARVVMLGYGGDSERTLRRAFSASGHDWRLIEPDFPTCKRNVELADPAAFLLDPSTKASHVREAASYFADLKRFRERPFFVLADDAEAAQKVRVGVARAVPIKVALALETVQSALAAGRTA